MGRVIIPATGFVLVVAVLVSYAAWKKFASDFYTGQSGEIRPAIVELSDGVDPAVVDARMAADQPAAPKNKTKQILFGDLHVHSTYSIDAFSWALPINMGKGIHPVADACDYARYCSAIDFWAITDHAEAATPERWKRTKDAVRQCNAKSPDPANPDLVSMLGFEWTQVGVVPSDHFGHKNVIFEGTADNEVAQRPIAADGVATRILRGGFGGIPASVSFADWENRSVYADFNTFLSNIRKVPDCDPDLPSNELPTNCFESTVYPEQLIERLESQGLDPLIIPHGSSWGFYTPQGTGWDKQLRARHRPEKFSLIEVYSGHGNSEEYRDFRALDRDPMDEEKTSCPAPHNNYTPPCWRAGEIIYQRCIDDGRVVEDCKNHAQKARQVAAKMDISYHLSVTGETPEDWLDSGQCIDCYLPAFQHRPRNSVQYGLAISNFDDVKAGEDPTRFNWGFIASSDNHRARAGTGYKEIGRRVTTESGGPANETLRKAFIGGPQEKTTEINYKTREQLIEQASFNLSELERQSSFWQTGGLVAVHSEGRDSAAIFEALRRRETYATSGPRMLLWFDHLNPQTNQVDPMGATIDADAVGRFKVKAVGSFKQKDGCPEHAVQALGQDRIGELCSNQCYFPEDERHVIERIEIIKITPQIVENEPVKNLIQDPYRVFDCPKNGNGCEIEFTDPEFSAQKRDALYYARAIQEPRPTINGEAIRCERDSAGNCIKAELCYGDYRSGDSECTTMTDVRAWSSPIYMNFPNDVAAVRKDATF